MACSWDPWWNPQMRLVRRDGKEIKRVRRRQRNYTKTAETMDIIVIL